MRLVVTVCFNTELIFYYTDFLYEFLIFFTGPSALLYSYQTIRSLLIDVISYDIRSCFYCNDLLCLTLCE